MAAGMKVTGLNEFVVELDLASSRMIPETAAVVGKGCGNIKRDWRRAWSSFKHLRGLASTVGYDVFTLPGQIRGEVGPDISRGQGPLGGVAEFGTPTSAPHPGGAPALDAEAPRFEAAMLAMTARLLP